MTQTQSPTAPAADRPRPRASWRFATLLFVAALDGVGTGIVLPLLPFLILHFGGAPAIVTQLVAGFSLAGFVANLVLGRLSDRVGRTKILKLSLAGSTVSYLGILFSWSLAGLFTFRLLGGLLSGRSALLPALLTDGEAPETHVRRLAWLATASSFGTVLGPIVAGVLAFAIASPLMQFRATLVTAASLTALAFIAVNLLVPGGRVEGPLAGKHKGAAKTSLRALWLPLALSTTTAFGQGVVLSVTALLVHARFGWGVAQTGLLLGMLAVGIAVARIFVLNRLVARLGPEGALAACLFAVIPTLAGIGLSTTPAAFVACIAIFSVAGGLANMLPTAMVSMRAPPQSRGYVMGVNAGLAALAMFISASCSGPLFQFVAPFAPHLLGVVVLTIGLALLSPEVLRLRRKTQLEQRRA